MKQLLMTSLMASAAPVPVALRCRGCAAPGLDLCGDCWAARAEEAQELRDHIHMLSGATDAEALRELADCRRRLAALG